MEHAIGTIVVLIALVLDWPSLNKIESKKVEGSEPKSSAVVQDSTKPSN